MQLAKPAAISACIIAPRPKPKPRESSIKMRNVQEQHPVGIKKIEVSKVASPCLFFCFDLTGIFGETAGI